MITGLDGVGQWLGLPGPGPHTIGLFLYGPIKAQIYILPADSEENLIARTVEAAATWHF
jgi:hypothetical protein